MRLPRGLTFGACLFLVLGGLLVSGCSSASSSASLDVGEAGCTTGQGQGGISEERLIVSAQSIALASDGQHLQIPPELSPQLLSGGSYTTIVSVFLYQSSTTPGPSTPRYTIGWTMGSLSIHPTAEWDGGSGNAQPLAISTFSSTPSSVPTVQLSRRELDHLSGSFHWAATVDWTSPVSGSESNCPSAFGNGAISFPKGPLSAPLVGSAQTAPTTAPSSSIAGYLSNRIGENVTVLNQKADTNDSSWVLVTFSYSTATDETLTGIDLLHNVNGQWTFVSGGGLYSETTFACIYNGAQDTTGHLDPTIPLQVDQFFGLHGPSPPPTTNTTGPESSTTTMQPSSALPTAPNCDPQLGGSGFEPTTIFVGCAISADNLGNIQWGSWTMTNATGTGTHNINNCEPDCAQGTFSSFPVEVTLSDPANLSGIYAFTTITMAPTTNAGSQESATDTECLSGSSGP